MSLVSYVRIWFLLTAFCVFECFMLNTRPEYGILGALKYVGFFPHLSLSPKTGGSISQFLGWTGFGIMCLTNFYSLRKRSFLNSFGKLGSWLDFHIFCGLVGPTLILFHTNFKIGGLVAVSFWSMTISFASGIVGRYFYLQIASQKKELEALIALQEQGFTKHAKISAENIEFTKRQALQLACVPADPSETGLVATLFYSLKGDIQMQFSFVQLTEGLSEQARSYLKHLVNCTRKHAFLEQFRRLMGYWHSFHMPFAIFMYVIAMIHILAVTLLAVGELS